MSVESLAIVLNHSTAIGSAKVVLLGIANHDGDGGAWPSIATLARYANLQPRQVQNCLRALEASGELVTHHGQGGTYRTAGNTRPNLYEISVACPPWCDRSAQHRDTRPSEGVHQSAPLGVQPSAPEPSCEPSPSTSTPTGAAQAPTAARSLVAHFVRRCRELFGEDPTADAKGALGSAIADGLDGGWTADGVKAAIEALLFECSSPPGPHLTSSLWQYTVKGKWDA